MTLLIDRIAPSTSKEIDEPRRHMLRHVPRKTFRRSVHLSLSSGSNGPPAGSFHAAADDDEPAARRLGREAKALTLSLYRTVLRSARLLGRCNENDEREFRAREEKRKRTLEDRLSDSRLSMMSMLPATDRVEELRSRRLYYQQYARENFTQESDCLDVVGDSYAAAEWSVDNISRFTYLLRRGEEHRQWLLRDMQFPDPYSNSFDQKRVEKFDQDAKAFASAGVNHAANHRLAAAATAGAATIMTKDDGSSVLKDDDIWNTDDEE
jgi:hypothetical protein